MVQATAHAFVQFPGFVTGYLAASRQEQTSVQRLRQEVATLNDRMPPEVRVTFGVSLVDFNQEPFKFGYENFKLQHGFSCHYGSFAPYETSVEAAVAQNQTFGANTIVILPIEKFSKAENPMFFVNSEALLLAM